MLGLTKGASLRDVKTGNNPSAGNAMAKAASSAWQGLKSALGTTSSNLNTAPAPTASKGVPALADASEQVKARLKAKADESFKKLKKMFLGAINTLDEEAIKETLVENQGLIDAGYLDVNQPIKDTNSTFLHTAVWYRKLDLVRFLLAHGADPNCRNLKGNTPLHFACENADKDKAKEIIGLLLAAGADVHLKNHDKKQTPMDAAEAAGFKNFVEGEMDKVVQQKTSIHTKADVRAWRKEVTEEFKRDRQRRLSEIPNMDSADGDDPRSARLMQRQSTRRLLKHQDSKQQLDLGPGASMGANGIGRGLAPSSLQDPKLQKRAATVFEELKKLFANVQDLNEMTVNAILEENEDLLGEGYLSLNTPISNTNSTFLHSAVWYHKHLVVQKLLEYGADPNAPNLKGNTPVHFACENTDKPHSKEILDLLLDAGGNLAMKNYTQNRSPLEKAPVAVQDYLKKWKKPNEATPRTPRADNKHLSDASKDQEGKGNNKASRIIDSILKENESLAIALTGDQAAESEWQSKLRKGSTSKSPLSDQAKQQLKELADELATQDLQAQNARSKQDEELLEKLNRGRQRQKNKREPTMLVTQELLDELRKEENAQGDVMKNQQAVADEELQKRIAMGRTKPKRRNDPAPQQQAQQQAPQEQQEQQQQQPVYQQYEEAPVVQDVMNVNAIFDVLDHSGCGSLTCGTLLTYHRELHCCDIPHDLVEGVARIAGSVTRENLLAVLQTLHLVCRRQQTLSWDFRCFDSRRSGVIKPSAGAEMIWTLSMDETQHMRFKDYMTAKRQQLGEMADEADLSFQEFRAALLL